MGKQGPCYHCGVTSTPLWRNGPPEKPVLCNACGSRWRTKGSLVNYTPLHARPEGDESDDRRFTRVKTISLKRGDEKLKKRKIIYENPVIKREPLDYNQEFPRITDEDTSNRSSSGSAVSLSECSVQFSSADASDLTGPAQSVVWEAQVPSKKRTCVSRMKSSSVEMLIKDLQRQLHEQQSSCLSGTSEEDLIFDSEEPMVDVEIGHGSVLIRHPSSLAREEESEASSLSVENKPCPLNEAYSRHVSVSGYNQLKAGNGCHSENVKYFGGGIIQQKPTKRDKSICERVELLCPHSSPLCCIDLNDVVNFEVLMVHFTSKEQQQLLKYLPSPDTFQLPGSLQGMFDSSCFKENLSCFQQLLSEGVFSNTYTGVKAEDFRTLKRLALSDAMKSKWAELYCQLKDSESNHQSGDNLNASGRNLCLPKDLGSANKLLLEEQYKNIPDMLTSDGSKRGGSKFVMESKETLGSDGGSFCTPKGVFGVSSDDQSVKLEESFDQDLLLDVPPNAFFPQAELLYPPSSFGSRQTSTNSSKYTHPSMINH